MKIKKIYKEYIYKNIGWIVAGSIIGAIVMGFWGAVIGGLFGSIIINIGWKE